jgi:HEAT repeat protein/beta-lactamase regulating signal transducer with metallopeptidase domain
MNVAPEITAFLTGLDRLWLPAVDALIKVTFVLGLAGIATVVLGRSSAAVRHLVWTLALSSALLLPVLSIALPRWQLPIVKLTTSAPHTQTLPEPSDEPSPSAAIHSTSSHRTASQGVVAPPSPKTTARQAAPGALREHAPQAQGQSQHTLPSTAPTAEVAATPRDSFSTVSLTMALVAIWMTGVLAVVGRLVVGIVAVAWMSRRTVRVVDAPWLPLAVELASELGITRRLTFLESPRASMPMASGIFKPSVLMPEDANRWPLERLRIVLLHELAHVKRRDCLTHVIVQLACALYWFNPLAWIAARHVRTERERACDDLVLACGTRGPDYAEELLEIARVMRGGRYPALLAGATLAMAHRSQLEGRLIAILDPKVPRAGVSRLRTVLTAVGVACALAPLAAMQPWTVGAPEHDPALLELVSEATPLVAAPQAPAAVVPQPEPRPNPSTRTEVGAPLATEIAQAVSDGVTQEATARAQAAVQGAVQGVIQSGVQGAWQDVAQAAWQGVVQGAVQGALQGALHGATVNLEALHGVGEQAAEQAKAEDAKRAAADPRMVAALTAALKDSDKEVRETAMHALIQLRDPSIFEPLVQALKDPSPDVREQAAHGLSQLRDKRAVEPLIGALKDSNASVRESAVHALSQLRDPRAVEGLIAALKDENPSVREQAAHALGQIRDPRAVDPLIATLKDANGDVREQAVHALSQLRDKRAASALAGLIKDPDEDVREQAVFALGQMRDVSAIDGLTAALRDTKPDVRQQAAFALGQIRDARAVPPLISSLKDEAADVREQAAFALGQIRDRSAVEALVIAIKDPAPDVREQVAFALGQLRDPRAIDALTTALKDASADVRQQAAFALGQLAR